MDHEGFDRLEIAGLVRTLYRYALPGGALGSLGEPFVHQSQATGDLIRLEGVIVAGPGADALDPSRDLLHHAALQLPGWWSSSRVPHAPALLLEQASTVRTAEVHQLLRQAHGRVLGEHRQAIGPLLGVRHRVSESCGAEHPAPSRYDVFALLRCACVKDHRARVFLRA